MEALSRLNDGKLLGGIGSILSIIPGVSIVGYILTLIGIKFISDELQDRSIFNDYLLAAITGIVGAAVAVFFGVFGFVTAPLTFGASRILGLISFLAIAWIALIISAIFVRRSFEKMANRLNVGTFRTAGTLYLIGAILVIVLVGFIILFIAFILQIVAFFSIPEAMTQPQGMPVSAAAAPMPGMKFCANCGTQLAANAEFCPKCGTKQPA